ncbi:hypothetical protein H0H92_003242, partial [Tricholoma furcatifolium]
TDAQRFRPAHKKTCKAPGAPKSDDGNDTGTIDLHPDLAMKLVLRVPVSDYLIHLFQVHAMITLSLVTNPDAIKTHMLQITVNTLPSDTM